VLLVTSRAAFFLEESSGIAQVVDAFFSMSARHSLHKSRTKKLAELTPNLAGRFIAICHSTDYTPRASPNGLSALTARKRLLKGFFRWVGQSRSCLRVRRW
jgi:hypothetical protein